MAHNNPADSFRILVLDDEPDLRMLYELTLLREGYRVDTAATVEEARAQLDAHAFDLVITDMRLPDGTGIDLLRGLRSRARSERSIVITAYGSAENAVEALRAGAFDYLTKPVDLRQFRTAVAAALQGQPQFGAAPAVASTVKGDNTPGEAALARMVGESDGMRQVRERVAKVARSMAPVLIHGESGTGKELVAQALHANSHRAQGPWVAVNCGAIPENLLEAEFFGVRKGAFTGATHDRDGFFKAAHGGTLFLDEIGDLPLAMQAKLLRAIQERCIRPLGGNQEEPIDVRIVSASHKNLSEQVTRGSFRQDLFYRLNVIDIDIPPLRDRPEDLPVLCETLLLRIARESGTPVKRLAPAALVRLARLPLHGNVRELENILHRAVALGDGDELVLEAPKPPAPVDTHRAAEEDAETMPASLEQLPEPPNPNALATDLQTYLDRQERAILVRTLREAGFNRSAAARKLGLTLRQIRYRIARLHIDMPEIDGEDMNA